MSPTSLLYQFLVGGLFFTVGIVVPWRAGDLSLRKRGDRWLLLTMVVAALVYLVVQTTWHLYAAASG